MRRKNFVIDVISAILISLNILSIISMELFGDKFFCATNFFGYIIVGLMMYAVFGMIISVLVGIVLNIITIFKKRKNGQKIIINIIFIVIFVLTIPIWNKYFFVALMGV